MRPGPLRLSVEIRTGKRVLPGIWIASDELHDFNPTPPFHHRQAPADQPDFP